MTGRRPSWISRCSVCTRRRCCGSPCGPAACTHVRFCVATGPADLLVGLYALLTGTVGCLDGISASARRTATVTRAGVVRRAVQTP
ncbi:hypothetical protein [Streptomyces sp. NPDC094437]|uniref:hypothetical protein n=1 Tax=Streptomyces sp. NPDC094437 TaxID=3366060 RepID=UPI00380F73AD